MPLNTESGPDNVVKIKIIGVGGAGNNALNRMVEDDIQEVDYIAVNTDRAVLATSRANKVIQIGEKLTGGKGAGASPEIGKKAAEETLNTIAQTLENTDMVFLAAGMGGGTGTGASPIIANLAREAGILTVAVVTKPFAFEGRIRMQQAESGLNNLLGKVDALLVIPNEKLKTLSDQKITMKNAFKIADDVLCNSVVSLANLIKNIGYINLDFADVTTILKDAGYTHVGFGHASGKGKAEEAARAAVISPLMDTSINGANRVLVQITCSSEIELEEIDTAMELIHEGAHPDANIIFGTDYNDDLDDEIFITVIATEFSDKPNAPDAFFSQPKYNPKPSPRPAQEIPVRQEKPAPAVDPEREAAPDTKSPVDTTLFDNPVFPAPPVSRVPNEDEQIDSILEIFKSR